MKKIFLIISIILYSTIIQAKNFDTGINELGYKLSSNINNLNEKNVKIVIKGFIEQNTKKRDAITSGNIEADLEEVLISLQKNYVVVERKRINILESEDLISSEGMSDKDTQELLSKSDLVITGTFTKNNGNLTIRAKIMDLKSTNILAKYKVTVQYEKNIKDLELATLNEQRSLANINEEISKLRSKKEKYKQIKLLKDKKALAIKKLNTLSDNKPIQSTIIKNRNFSYLNITSNVDNTEIYIDHKYIGIAPIQMYKIPSNKNIEIKGIVDENYYDSFISNVNINKLDIEDININFTRAISELYFTGHGGRDYLYINDTFIKVLNNKNRIIKIESAKDISIVILGENGKVYKNILDVYKNNLYDINYNLEYDIKVVWSLIKSSAIKQCSNKNSLIHNLTFIDILVIIIATILVYFISYLFKLLDMILYLNSFVLFGTSALFFASSANFINITNNMWEVIIILLIIGFSVILLRYLNIMISLLLTIVGTSALLYFNLNAPFLIWLEIGSIILILSLIALIIVSKFQIIIWNINIKKYEKLRSSKKEKVTKKEIETEDDKFQYQNYTRDKKVEVFISLYKYLIMIDEIQDSDDMDTYISIMDRDFNIGKVTAIKIFNNTDIINNLDNFIISNKSYIYSDYYLKLIKNLNRLCASDGHISDSELNIINKIKSHFPQESI